MAFSALLGAAAVHAADYSDITVLLKSGKAADALAKADQRLASAPKDPQLRFLRGVAQADSGKPNDAIATFTQLTQEYPELPEPYNNLAVLYAGQNQLDKARTALEMAIRTNPSYATAHENMGDIYAKLAAQAYNKALQLDATNSAALNPKLALIRELFAPGRTPGVPTRTATAPAAAAATRAPAAPAVASAPPATPPAVAAAPVVAAAPAAAPKPPVAAPVTPVAETAPAAAPVRTPAAEPVSAPAARSDSASGADTAAQQDVESAVKAWAAAWSARDMKNYLSSYGKQFDPPGSQSRSAWEKEREARIVGKKQIKVTITDLSVDVKGDKATARFHQAYSADTLSVASRKTLELARSQGRWVIVRESTGS